MPSPMSNFIIFRTEKLKSATALTHSLKHAMREQPTPNADPKRLSKNHYFELSDGNILGGTTVDKCMEEYRKRLPEKVRKNAVHCVEVLVSGSPEHLATLSREEQISFFRDSAKYVADKLGGTQNIIHAQIHYDEKTPHLTMFVMPIDEKGKLNARKFIGGSKQTMRDFQSEIAEKVGKKYRLDRGVAKTKPDNHIEIGDYYQILKDFTKYVENKNFTPSEQYLDSLAKDVAMLMKRDETEEEIKKIREEMNSIRDKWNKWSKSQGLTATVESHSTNPQFTKWGAPTISAASSPESQEFQRESWRWGEFKSHLENDLFPVKKVIDEVEEKVMGKLNLLFSGISGVFGLMKPEQFVPAFLSTYKEELMTEVKKRKLEQEKEKEIQKAELERERKAISEQRLNLEEVFSKEKTLEIERLKSELVKKNEEVAKKNQELARKDKEIQNLTDGKNDLIEQINDSKTLNNQLSEKVNVLTAENQQIKQNLNNPDYLAKRHEEITLAREKISSTNRMSFKM